MSECPDAECRNAVIRLQEWRLSLEARVETHIETCERSQKEFNALIGTISGDLAKLRGSLDGISTSIRWLLALLLLVVPTVTGLLVYIFKTHTHGS